MVYVMSVLDDPSYAKVHNYVYSIFISLVAVIG